MIINDGDFKLKTIEYCEMDCELLGNLFYKYEVLLTKMEIPRSNFMTATGLAFAYFKSQIKPKLYIEGVTSNIYEKLKMSYYGGFTCNFKKKCTGPLFCYDINSSYPAVMRKNLMPSRKISNGIFIKSKHTSLQTI